MRIILITLLFLLSNAYVFGQNTINIAGKVISEEGIVSDAYVIIKNQGSITNSEGLFKFEYSSETVPNKLKIEVSALGYKTQEFIFSTDETNFKELILSLNLYPNINSSTAKEDIKNGNIKFLLSGGIAPTIFSSDKKFTKKYGVTFHEFGCEPVSNESLKQYNSVVAKYLDEKYGNKWRKLVRDDIVGIN